MQLECHISYKFARNEATVFLISDPNENLITFCYRVIDKNNWGHESNDQMSSLSPYSEYLPQPMFLVP